eukprot:CAMPEP_0114584560 /NCGR_PEP_ID=MMETSP0125-20121206/8235_1 /TAXON_ID=485358 ORGANISM="Aristerostoma sp., Strain ATCC 50986" /NCGR_SAMPLE_ID=MMETSP0125 /ASSEMBLY_ACC=CAM_ASM_000245 /LENGTH=225 /DNA_ID=CAMNT_0001779023 /DNA_START=150 /DNA_END=827 /DNA_ORIENTATION=+
MSSKPRGISLQVNSGKVFNNTIYLESIFNSVNQFPKVRSFPILNIIREGQALLIDLIGVLINLVLDLIRQSINALEFEVKSKTNKGLEHSQRRMGQRNLHLVQKLEQILDIFIVKLDLKLSSKRFKGRDSESRASLHALLNISEGVVRFKGESGFSGLLKEGSSHHGEHLDLLFNHTGHGVSRVEDQEDSVLAFHDIVFENALSDLFTKVFGRLTAFLVSEESFN